MNLSLSNLARRLSLFAAALALVATMGGTWTTRAASAAPSTAPGATRATPTSTAFPDDDPPRTSVKKSALAGKLNLNTATPDQLMMLPSVGPSKAERIVVWRKKNGGFKRIADLRRVKGFGYRTFKRLEPLLDIKGDTTLAAK